MKMSQVDIYKYAPIIDGLPGMDRCDVWKISKNKLNIVCAKCGIRGTHCIAFKQKNDTNGRLWYGVIHKRYDPFKKNDTCHMELMTLDHILPKSNGGRKSAIFNGQVMCYACNQNKKNIVTKVEFERILENLPSHVAPTGAATFHNFVKRCFPMYQQRVRSFFEQNNLSTG